ncbi:hypothetical protein ACFL5Z_02770 [Planctomycetota bacterium]
MKLLLTSLIPILLVGCHFPGKTHTHLSDDADETVTYRSMVWEIDPRPVLTRSEGKAYDSRVVGDPCIVWDEEASTWRMFYFAGGYTPDGGWRVGTGMALSKSAEAISPGDWVRQEPVCVVDETAFMNPLGWHKWWIVMDPKTPNRVAKIDNKYWSVFTVTVKSQASGGSNKHLQVAFADRLSGPWKVRRQPILSPDADWFDGKHCDTPTAYWFEDRNEVILFYKAYPKVRQDSQPGSPFGSGMVIARWHPTMAHAQKLRVIQRPSTRDAWNQGWMSTPQVFFDPKKEQWYGLINGSPTAPVDESHREPAPSPLGGWVTCKAGQWLDGDWEPDTLHSPFLFPEDLTREEMEAGLGINFWRHHLLITPGGQARIYFNSGKYGTEQMYSLVGNVKH